MKTSSYVVTLTNDLTFQEYNITALSQTDAIILAQAEAIKLGRGHKFTSIVTME